MSEVSNFRLTAVWIGLVVVTAISWFTGSSGAEPMQVSALVTGVVLAISALKARIILREFMEVNHASRALKRITDAWVVVTLVLLVGVYTFGRPLWDWMEIHLLHLLP